MRMRRGDEQARGRILQLTGEKAAGQKDLTLFASIIPHSIEANKIRHLMGIG